MPFLKPEYTLFHLADPRKKEKPLLSAESGRLGDMWPPFFAAYLSENFCSVLRDDMDLQVSTDLVLNLVLTPVGGFFACFVLVVCCS